MDVSIFLAKVIGLYLIIFGLPFLFNAKYYQTASKQIIENDGSMFALNVITLILGVLLVVAHNIWVMDWRVVITLLAWITLLRSIVRLYFPTFIQTKATSLLKSSTLIVVSGIVSVIIGLFLCYHGFFS